LARIRNYFITGLIVLFPVVATWRLLVWLFNLLDEPLRGVIGRSIGYVSARWGIDLPAEIPGLGLIITLIVVFLVGLLAANFIGRRLISYGEALMRRTPVVRTVYGTVKQLTDAFVRQDKTVFKRVAVIEYPRRGSYCLAFVTAEAPPGIKTATNKDLVGVFIPTTPNPTSGYLLYLPRHDITILDIPVDDGLKLIISGGVFAPAGEIPAGGLTTPEAPGGETPADTVPAAETRGDATRAVELTGAGPAVRQGEKTRRRAHEGEATLSGGE